MLTILSSSFLTKAPLDEGWFYLPWLYILGWLSLPSSSSWSIVWLIFQTYPEVSIMTLRLKASLYFPNLFFVPFSSETTTCLILITATRSLISISSGHLIMSQKDNFRLILLCQYDHISGQKIAKYDIGASTVKYNIVSFSFIFRSVTLQILCIFKRQKLAKLLFIYFYECSMNEICMHRGDY